MFVTFYYHLVTLLYICSNLYAKSSISDRPTDERIPFARVSEWCLGAKYCIVNTAEDPGGYMGHRLSSPEMFDPLCQYENK